MPVLGCWDVHSLRPFLNSMKVRLVEKSPWKGERRRGTWITPRDWPTLFLPGLTHLHAALLRSCKAVSGLAHRMFYRATINVPPTPPFRRVVWGRFYRWFSFILAFST